MSQLGRRQRAVRHALCNVVASQRTVGTDAVALVLAHGLEDGLADLLPPAVAGSGNSSVHDRIAETIGMPASWPWVSVDARSFSPAPTSPFLNLIALARSMVCGKSRFHGCERHVGTLGHVAQVTQIAH